MAFMGKRKGAYTVLEAKPKKDIPHERLRRKWEENIKTNLEKNRMGGDRLD